MRIILITQDEPFYLCENLSYFFDNLNSEHQVVGCVVADPSPFGKKSSFIRKIVKTINVFGIKFFFYYSVRFVYSKIFRLPPRRLLEDLSIPLIQTKGSINSRKNLDLIELYKPDLLISILGTQILKKPIIDLAPKGCINLHTSLLPKYRGLMPTFWVLKNNEKYTGVSVFFVDEGIDSGPIILQERVEIGNRTQRELITHTKKIGMRLILQAIELIHHDKMKLTENNDGEKTYFSFPTREDVVVFQNQGKKFF